MTRDKIKEKLKSHGGESIAETLVALLISALALVMLAGAITSASNMIRAERKKMEDYYVANEAANGVVKMGSGTDGTITLVDSTSAISHSPYPVTYFKNDKFGNLTVVAYKYKTVPVQP